jgi:type II secretory pathway component PulM
MSRFPLLSDWFARLNPRERRVVAGGALASLMIVAGVWVVLPLVRRWEDREALIAARQVQLAQLTALVRGDTAVQRTLASRERDRVALRQRLLTGGTPALAASNLQALLQGYADASRVTLERVDLVAEPEDSAKGGLPVIPVQLSASGDIYGLADLLVRLQYGGKLLSIDELRVGTGAAEDDDRRGGSSPLLTISMRLHAVYGAP